MPSLPDTLGRWTRDVRDALRIAVAIDRAAAGPLLIDRGRGLLYDVERDIT